MGFCEEAVTGYRGRGFALLEGWRVGALESGRVGVGA